MTVFAHIHNKTKTPRLLAIIITIAIAANLLHMPANAVSSWDGKSELKPGVTYEIYNEVRIAKSITIPEKTRVVVRAGGSLVFNKTDAVFEVRGELIAALGGSVELMRGTLRLRGKSALGIYGNLKQYTTGTLQTLSDSAVTVYNRGEYTNSGTLQMFAGSSMTVKRYAMFTKASETTLTGTVTVAAKAEAHLQGQFSITKSGALTNSGHMTIGRSGIVKNSGIITITSTGSLSRFGELQHTKSGVFIDEELTDPYEKFTISSLVDEPNVKIYGIDASYAQDIIDWEKVAQSGAQFAIIRASRGYISDTKPMKADDFYYQNIEGALSAGLDVGVYHYSYATSVREIQSEARFLLSIIKDYEISYPVVLDMEENLKGISVAVKTDMVEAFFKIIMDAGYFPMIYSYKTWFEEHLDTVILDKYAVWLAEWKDAPSYQGGFYIWQYTAKGSVSGIVGQVDMNIAYRDFPAIFRNLGLNRLPKSTETPTYIYDEEEAEEEE